MNKTSVEEFRGINNFYHMNRKWARNSEHFPSESNGHKFDSTDSHVLETLDWSITHRCDVTTLYESYFSVRGRIDGECVDMVVKFG